MTTASSVCRGAVLISSRLRSASSAAISSGWRVLALHWQTGAMAVFWEVSGTDHQLYRVRRWILTSHFWLMLIFTGPR